MKAVANRRLVAQIGLNRYRHSAAMFHGFHGLLGLVRRMMVMNDHRIAAIRERIGNVPANSMFAAAGNQGYLLGGHRITPSSESYSPRSRGERRQWPAR